VAVAGVTCGAVIMTGIAFSMLEPICALLVGLAGGAIGAVGNYLLKPRSMLVIVHNFLPLGFLQRTIVKASNFELCGNFGPFLASSVASLIKLCIKNEQNRICRSKFFLQLSFCSFVCRTRFDDNKPFWKTVQSLHEVHS
jgi:hypothetical protein